MVRQNVTGAGYGIYSWLSQRITAVFMLVFTVAFFVFLVFMSVKVNSSIVSWQSLFHCVFTQIIFQIFFLAVFLHSWIGMRDLWMDYVTSSIARLVLHVLTITWLFVCVFYSINIIWS